VHGVEGALLSPHRPEPRKVWLGSILRIEPSGRAVSSRNNLFDRGTKIQRRRLPAAKIVTLNIGLKEKRNGTRTRRTALAAGHTAANYNLAGSFLALKTMAEVVSHFGHMLAIFDQTDEGADLYWKSYSRETRRILAPASRATWLP
jgi:hypothetical protein